MLSTTSGVRSRGSTLFRRRPTGWSYVALIRSRTTELHEAAVRFSDERTLVRHYSIVKYGSKGFELPDILSHSGEVILPIFSSEQAAREFLCLSPPGERWCVRGFSGGELASVLFASHARVKGVLLDPHPGVDRKSVV